MNGATIYAKTASGHEALAHRTAALAQRVRSVLILVDGKTRAADLLNKCAFIPQCAEHLAWLEAQGLIAPVGAYPAAPPPSPVPVNVHPSATPPVARADESAPRAIDLKPALIQLAQALLGAHGGSVVQRLTDAGDSHDALVLATDRCYKLIRLSIDENKAEQFRRSANALLNGAAR